MRLCKGGLVLLEPFRGQLLPEGLSSVWGVPSSMGKPCDCVGCTILRGCVEANRKRLSEAFGGLSGAPPDPQETFGA